MARLLTCGFETGDVNEAGASVIGANYSLAAVNTNPTPRTGGAYCLKLGVTTGTSMSTTYKSFSLGALKTDVWVRFAFQAHGVLSGASTELAICTLLDNATTVQVAISWSAQDNLLRAYRGTVASGTLLGASSASLASDVWRLIEVRWQATSTTVGIVEVWLDGNRVINFSGDTTSSTVVGLQTVYLGCSNSVTGASTTATWLAFDDIAINDTTGTANNGRPQDGRILLLSPTGAGSSTQFTRGGTDTGANWSQTSEVPPSMTQYVLSATVADRDLYAAADLPVAVSGINVVEELLLVQNSDAGAGSIGPTIRSGATTSELGPISLTNTVTYVTGRWETDPNTSAAWTAAAVNALEIGATVR